MTPQMAYFWTNDESANSNFLSNVTHRNSLDAEIPYRTLSEVTYNYIIDINTFKPLTIFLFFVLHIQKLLRKLYYNEKTFTYNDI